MEVELVTVLELEEVPLEVNVVDVSLVEVCVALVVDV